MAKPRDELHRCFMASVPEMAANLAGHDDLARVLDEGFERGRAAWPQLTVSMEGWAAVVATAVRDAIDPIAAIGELALEDLYLARACVAGDSAAVAAVTALCAPAVTGSLRGMRLSDDVIADVTQDVHVKLFAAADGAPKISSYSGRASLKSWVRTIATRTAIDRIRKPEAEPASDEVLYRLPDVGAGPELGHFRARYAKEFKEAFEAALSSLEVRERNMLRHHFIDQLSFDDIGALYGAHKTTAFRWVEAARDKLSKRTRNHFQDRVQLSPQEMASVLKLLQSNIDLSLSRVLS